MVIDDLLTGMILQVLQQNSNGFVSLGLYISTCPLGISWLTEAGKSNKITEVGGEMYALHTQTTFSGFIETKGFKLHRFIEFQHASQIDEIQDQLYTIRNVDVRSSGWYWHISIEIWAKSNLSLFTWENCGSIGHLTHHLHQKTATTATFRNWKTSFPV